MPPRPQFDSPEPDEVPEKPGGYVYSEIVKEYDDAWSRIKQPSPFVDKIVDKPNTRGAFHVRRVLMIARERYQPGDLVSPAELAKVIGTSRQNVSNAISALRRADQWPYRGTREPKNRKFVGL